METNTQNTTSRRSNRKSDLPVSKQFYNKLIQSAHRISTELGCADDKMEWLILLIDDYLLSRKTVDRADLSADDMADVYIVFVCLRQEIDKAISRSERARLRAAERRSRRPVEKPRQSVEPPTAEVDTTSSTSANHTSDSSTNVVKPLIPTLTASDSQLTNSQILDEINFLRAYRGYIEKSCMRTRQNQWQGVSF